MIFLEVLEVTGHRSPNRIPNNFIEKSQMIFLGVQEVPGHKRREGGPHRTRADLARGGPRSFKRWWSRRRGPPEPGTDPSAECPRLPTARTKGGRLLMTVALRSPRGTKVLWRGLRGVARGLQFWRTEATELSKARPHTMRTQSIDEAKRPRLLLISSVEAGAVRLGASTTRKKIG